MPVLGQSDFDGGSSATVKSLLPRPGRRCWFRQTAARTWAQRNLPSYVTIIRGVSVTPDAQILVASREGAFHSADSGANWTKMVAGLPDKDITSIMLRPTGNRLLATSFQTGVIFQSVDSGRTWQRGPDSGLPAAPRERGSRTFRGSDPVRWCHCPAGERAAKRGGRIGRGV